MKRLGLASIALLLLASVAAASPQEVIDRVLAVVGGQVITQSDVRAVSAFGLARPTPGTEPAATALDYLVNRQLMLNEVDRYSPPEVDPAPVAARLNAIRAQVGPAGTFDGLLAKSAWTADMLRDFVAGNLRIEAYLEQRFSAQAQPTAEEVERYYREHPTAFTRAGRLLPFEDVQRQATERVTAERRAALVADWLDRLRRRVNIRDLYR